MKKFDKHNIEDIFMLTPIQEGMLFHYLKAPDSEYYFEQLSLDICGEIDFHLFEKAWNVVVETNEMLRTVFRWEKLEQPMQVVLKAHKLQPEFYDCSNPGEDSDITQKKKQVEEIKEKNRKAKFNLQEVPFRVALFKIEEDKFEMTIRNHHILYDGWSNGIILREFFNAYHELALGRVPLKPVKTKFRDFINWYQTSDRDKQREFWNDYFKGFDNPLGLPMNRGRERPGSTESVEHFLGADLKNELEVFVKNNRLTLAAVLYTALGILLQKYCSSDDVIFGTTVAGRNARIKGIEEMVGPFINTIPLRFRVYPGDTINDSVRGVDRILQQRSGFENTSLVDIRQYSAVEGSQPLFDTIVTMENYPLDKGLLPGESSLSVHSFSMVEMTHYDLTVGIMPFNEIEVKFAYNPSLFDKKSAETLAGHFERILRQIVENSEEKVYRLEIISGEEKKRVLYDFNNTAADYPKDKTIHQLFVDQVKRTPDHIAIVGQSLSVGVLYDSPRLQLPSQITYKELNEESGHLSYILKEKGIRPGTIVGIVGERIIEVITGIMAILKAGGVYLPIDPNYPQERIDFILKDSGAKIFLTAAELPGAIRDERVKPLQLPLKANASPQDIAYVIYTSGSTGKPKGVMVEHGSAVNLLYALQDEYFFAESDAYLLKTSYVFDVSITELFGWYMGGGRMVMLEKGAEKDPGIILDSIERNEVSHINFVPSMFNAFIEYVTGGDKHRLSSLKYIFLAGEALLPELVTKFKDLETTIRLENIYGPTEGTVYASMYSLSAWKGRGSIPIGKPLPNVKLYVIGRNNHLQPIGVPGELCIGGSGLARGYLNRGELTAEMFTANPFSPGERVYGSGDLARWLPGGNIEFLGRMDQQVKIRGFRIEPGEVENLLLRHAKIKEAVVMVKEDDFGDKLLVAYCVTGQDFPVEELREYLTNVLPDYMVPSSIVLLEKMPLTPSGKIDRKALPEPQKEPGEIYVEPRGELEKKLAEIWAGVLGIDKNRIGINDNFFRLNGHSLKATVLISKMHKEVNIKLPVEDIFNFPTIRKLASRIRDKKSQVEVTYAPLESVEEKEYYALSSAQNRLYLLYQVDKNTTAYNLPLIEMLAGEPEKEELNRAFNRLIERHESLRTSFEQVNGETVQRIHPAAAFTIDYHASGSSSTIEDLICDFVRPFNLAQAPLLRVEVVKIEENKHLLMVDMHHIIADGASAEILMREFMALLEGENLPPVGIQYKDFSGCQELEEQKSAMRALGEFWLNEFQGDLSRLNLPLDYPRPRERRFDGAQFDFELGEEETAALKRLAQEEEATLYMVLLALFNILVYKLTGQEDIVVGTPVKGRYHEELQHTIGMFANTLALRNYPEGRLTFKGFLKEVKERSLRAFEHQAYPFEELVKYVAPGRHNNRTPVFDIMFAMQDLDIPELRIPGLTLAPYRYKRATAKFDFILIAAESGNTLSLTMEYSTKLFKPETILQFSRYFKDIASAVTEDRDIELSSIKMSFDLVEPESVISQELAGDFGF